MRLLETFSFAAGALRGHARRTSLALVGVAIGIAAVIVLTALGEGARRYVVGQFAGLGTNLLIVFPGKTETSGGIPGMLRATHDLTLDDAQAIQRRVAGILALAPLSIGNETVAWRDRRRQVAVLGSTAELLETRDLAVASGSFLPPGPMDRGSSVVVLGPKLARELFGAENPLGQVVRVGDWRMRVIGVLEHQGMHMGLDQDDMAVVPVATGMRMFDVSTLFRIIIETGPHVDQEETKRRVLELIADRHDEEDVTVWTQDAVIGALSSILVVLTAALAGIGAISLTVAGIGIMNVMLVSVSERTREVGLLSAIGAARRQVLAVFLAEAVLISSSGGLIGMAAGAAAVLVTRELFPAFPAAPPGWAVGAAVAVSLGVGVLFGLLPAWKATRLDPASALARR